MSDGPAREMTPKEQTRDYERVNGAFDRARSAEVRQYGPNGYQGDPDIKASERRAEIMGDATMQKLPSITQDQRDAARAVTPAQASTPATQNAQRQNEPDRARGMAHA